MNIDMHIKVFYPNVTKDPNKIYMNIIEFYYQERFKMMCKISFILLALAQK
jgi:hypothetical protein